MQYHNIWIRNSEDGNMTLVMSLDLAVGYYIINYPIPSNAHLLDSRNT